MLAQSGFRAWSRRDVADILAAVETTVEGVLIGIPASPTRAAYVAGARVVLDALYAAFGLKRP
jgi:hypothetical protein